MMAGEPVDDDQVLDDVDVLDLDDEDPRERYLAGFERRWELYRRYGGKEGA